MSTLPKKRRLIEPVIILICVFLFAACAPGTVGSSQPSRGYRMGEQLLDETFDSSGDWKEYAGDGIDVAVREGIYQMHITVDQYVFGLHNENHTDVIIEADTLQLSGYRSNGYGVMCRASSQNNGNGYYFLISGDGQFSIRYGQGRGVQPLIRWTYSPVIHQDRASNTIRAVCIGDYLALYVNDVFLAEAHNSLYQHGRTGLAVVMSGEGETDIAFDDVQVWAGS